MARSSLEIRTLWKKRLGRFQKSKLTVAQFCQQENVSVPSFYQWKRKLREGNDLINNDALKPKSFLPVKVTGTAEMRVTFPNGTQLALPTHDRELVKLAVESLANAANTQGDA